MKRFFSIFLIILCVFIMHAQEKFSSLDNLYLNLGAGFWAGDNGQPTSISNIAVAWDINLGYWFGSSKYGGLRLGYTGDVLQSFNYSARKTYGWNTLYLDGMLNVSNLIYKTRTIHTDPRWYCSPFVSLECLVPMAQNSHKSAFGVGLGIANEVNVHKNISVTLDWRNTLALSNGISWLPEINAGLKFYFTGNARHETPDKQPNLLTPSNVVSDCTAKDDSIKILTKKITSLNEKIIAMESDTSIYHIEDKVIRDYIRFVCRLPYHNTIVNRAISVFPKIKDSKIRNNYTETIKQLHSYYDLTYKLFNLLSNRQNQLNNSPTFNKSRWERGLNEDLEEFKGLYDFSELLYLKGVIDKVLKESKRPQPDFTDYISELQRAINTKK